ncbi:hypothetical protein QUB56_32470 [Microcoleus sp. AR_TQ3_B6]|uniref:hypothetical protein n=1 Tax=Microcoleus sp. AR_TQ3_B6 TaxID=3055284 RepID=UPI002FD5B7D5
MSGRRKFGNDRCTGCNGCNGCQEEARRNYDIKSVSIGIVNSSSRLTVDGGQ